MRLSSLELIAYGPFRGFTLDFSAPGLHVVLGRNEAGKSTTLRAITGFFYGIDAKTPDAHLHKFADLRIGGVLEDAGGGRIRLVRRKGNTNTLLDDRDQALDESVMKKLLAGVSKETFVHAFGLTHEALAAGAQALLDGRGDLGESLFDASLGGGGEVQRLVAELKAEAERIYKPRGSSLPLNDALKSFADAQKSVREKESKPEAFLAQERGLKDATDERDARIEAKAALATRRAKLERARRRLPLERRRQRAIEKRTELGLSAEHVKRIDELRDRFGSYKHALDHGRAALTEAERLTDRVAEAARRAGLDAAQLHSASRGTESFRLDARIESRIGALLASRTKHAGAIDSVEAEISKQERELARLAECAGEARSRLGGQQADVDGAALATALERARDLGDIEARLAAKRAQLERKKKDLESRANGDGLFSGRLEDFVVLRVPQLASVERLESLVEQRDAQVASIDQVIASLEKEGAAIDRQIASHAGDFAPPDVSLLLAARSARDEARRVLREASEPARRSAEIDMERLLREADAVADRMIREADRVTALSRLRSEADTNARQLERAREERGRAAVARAAHDGDLRALFADARIEPPHPTAFAEMRAWLDRHSKIIESFAALREGENEVRDDEQRMDCARRDLLRALAAAGSGVDDPTNEPAPLGELIAVALRRLAAIDASRRAAADAERAILKLRVELNERLAGRDRDRAALADVSAKLAELVTPLGIPGDASDDEVIRSLKALNDLFALADKRADAEARARAYDAEIRAFEGDLARAITDLAPDLASQDLRDAAPMLLSRATDAHGNAQELERVTSELDAEPEVNLDAADRALVRDDPDAAARLLDDLAEQIDDAEGEITRLTERIGGLRSGLEQMRAESNAAEAAGDAQFYLARVREHAERWCRVRLAGHLLSREIERYREENQGPLLASSSSLFSRLTLGAFTGIKAGFDDRDRPALRCVRADGRDLDVAGLSDGTRDQLYLSLRLASLIRRVDVAESMPLVLDDVLIQLDDQRAAAALGVLAEVSKSMQVLFFTHHARLVELARDAVPAADLVVHELAPGSREARSAVASGA